MSGSDLTEVEDKNVGDCKFCGETIAWLTSQKTGKKYPVNIEPEDQDEIAPGALVRRNNFHNCRDK